MKGNAMGHADLYDQAADASRQGLQKAEDAARRSIEQLSEGVGDVRDTVTPMLRNVRARVADASDRTMGYVREQPVRSVLAMVAAGTLMYALVRLLGSRSR